MNTSRIQRSEKSEAYIDLDAYVQEYKQALVWLTHGNHKETPKPTVKQTQRFIKELREKITGLLTEIENEIAL
jgi:hypothetical protein